MEQGRRGTAPVLGSGKFLYAYGTQANVNQIGLLYFLLNHLGTSINSQLQSFEWLWDTVEPHLP